MKQKTHFEKYCGIYVSLFIILFFVVFLYSKSERYNPEIERTELKTIYKFNCPYNESIYFIADYDKSVVNQFNYNPKYNHLRKCWIEILGYGEEIEITECEKGNPNYIWGEVSITETGCKIDFEIEPCLYHLYNLVGKKNISGLKGDRIWLRDYFTEPIEIPDFEFVDLDNTPYYFSKECVTQKTCSEKTTISYICKQKH